VAQLEVDLVVAQLEVDLVVAQLEVDLVAVQLEVDLVEMKRKSFSLLLLGAHFHQQLWIRDLHRRQIKLFLIT
jgi:hypothetical protein